MHFLNIEQSLGGRALLFQVAILCSRSVLRAFCVIFELARCCDFFLFVLPAFRIFYFDNK